MLTPSLAPSSWGPTSSTDHARLAVRGEPLVVTVLGCAGSFYDLELRHPCSGYLLDSGGTSVILDCGFGTFASFLDLARNSDVRGIVLSHAHRDHYADLSDFLAWARAANRSLAVVASVDTFDVLADTIDMRGAEQVVVEHDSCIELGDFALEFATTTHQIPTLGVRVSVGNSHVVYSADTGPGWHMPSSWRRPDIAILECTYLDRGEASWPYHLSSNDVADLAMESEAATTLMTHVPPHADGMARLRLAQQAAPSRVFVLAELGQRVTVTPERIYE